MSLQLLLFNLLWTILIRPVVATTLILLAMLFSPADLSAQNGRIEGSVVNYRTGDPITGAHVSVVGTILSGETDAHGRYLVEDVPPGLYTVRVNADGFRPAKASSRLVGSEMVTTIDFSLSPVDPRYDVTVDAGVPGPRRFSTLPFVVDQVTASDFPIPPRTIADALYGRIPGVHVVKTDGAPETAPTVLLRHASSINTTGRSNEPLYVVDGVVLGESIQDIDGFEIARVEVVKGPAASIYGSRGANGVIEVHTERGADISEGELRFRFRTEFGRNELAHTVPVARSHWYRIDDQGNWIGTVTDAAGTRDSLVDPNDRARAIRETGWGPKYDAVVGETDWDSDGVATPHQYIISDNPYFGQTYDHFDQLFDRGRFYKSSLSAGHRSGPVNFWASLHETRESGIVDGVDGYLSRGGRFNIDYRSRNWQLSATSLYAQSQAAELNHSYDGFYEMYFYSIDVDLLQLNESPRDHKDYLINPDPSVVEANPAYLMQNADQDRARTRFMGFVGLRWTPALPITLAADLSIDGSDDNYTLYYFKGFRTLDCSCYDGYLSQTDATTHAVNASLIGTYTNRFGDLDSRFTISGSSEQASHESFFGTSGGFSVGGVKDLDGGGTQYHNAGGATSRVRSLNLYANAYVALKGRYIFDATVLSEGSSVYGKDQRWQWYYRLGIAYRISQEPWWSFDWVDDLKLRYTIGSTGGRPSFPDQYETYNVSGGEVTKAYFGNPMLGPEKTTESELGLDMVLGGSLAMSVTHASSRVEDQILLAPLAAYFGFHHQWRNAGTVEANTWEISLRAPIVDQPDLGWDMRFVLDRTRQTITELAAPPYREGHSRPFRIQEGASMGAIYGARWATSCDEILTKSGLNAAGVCDNFQVNDDGYLVPVGVGHSYSDGIFWDYYGSKITIDGVEFDWGLPVKAHTIVADTFTDAQVRVDTTDHLPIGNTQPDLQFGIGQRFRYKNLSVYALLDAQIGGDVYNNTRQWPLRDHNGWEVDQAGKEEGDKKPLAYYSRLYDVNAVNSHFVENASYLKLREVAISYTFDRRQQAKVLGLFDRVTLSLIGRNLYTWTSYTGWDPEVGSSVNGVVNRIDAFGYPSYRTVSGSIEVEF
jgi:TonB-linked SusC/RagA family outer membrane protein